MFNFYCNVICFITFCKRKKKMWKNHWELKLSNKSEEINLIKNMQNKPDGLVKKVIVFFRTSKAITKRPSAVRLKYKNYENTKITLMRWIKIKMQKYRSASCVLYQRLKHTVLWYNSNWFWSQIQQLFETSGVQQAKRARARANSYEWNEWQQQQQQQQQLYMCIRTATSNERRRMPFP